MSTLAMPRGIVPDLAARQPALAAAGWAMLALAGACLVLMAFDPRIINGVSVWVKPAKFAATFVIWYWTLAWAWGVLDEGARHGIAARIVLWGMLGVGFAEQGWLTCRAALGLPSHFAQDALGSFVYVLMGVGAFTLCALAVLLGVLVLWRGDRGQALPWRLAVALGLILGGALGAFTGASISEGGGPRIGGTQDDARNLAPFFWSRDGGDLRIAHFVGIHAMQALPALALMGAGAATIWLGAAGWTALTLAMWFLACAPQHPFVERRPRLGALRVGFRAVRRQRGVVELRRRGRAVGPALDDGGGGFRVELHAHRAWHREGLGRAGILGEDRRPRRRGDGVAVPARPGAGEDGIAHGLDAHPAAEKGAIRDAPRITARGGRHHLRAEADADGGPAGRQALRDEVAFARDPGDVRFVHAMRGAEQDHGLGGLHRGVVERFAGGDRQRVALIGEPFAEGAFGREIAVADDQQLHRFVSM
ncbi:hypothetical protein J4558_20690 [Leptolyngbya sp. 15MV]|nr:hypothetical protein J4558_20690 [Leptolyngbya sp. 15MV]